MNIILFLLTLILSTFLISCSAGQDPLGENVSSEVGEAQSESLAGGFTAASEENQCLPQIKTCDVDEERVSVFDSNGCEQIICNVKVIEKLPEPPSFPPPPAKEPNEAVCRVHMGAHYIDLRPSDGYINRYVASISSYYPTKGKYGPGIQMYCERQYVRCSSRGEAVGKLGGRVLQTRLIADRDQSQCVESTFVGHPEYTYKQYKEWYVDIVDKYQTCHKREPTPIEVGQAIGSLLDEGKNIYDVYNSICRR